MVTQSSSLRVGIDSTDMESGARKGESALDRLGRKAQQTETQMSGATKAASILGKTFGALVAGIGVASVLEQATTAALDFGKGVSLISTQVDPLTFDMDALTAAMRAQAVEFGSLPTDQVKAGYDIVSAGATSAANAIETLDAANRLAVGGATDVGTAADVLTSVLNAYGDQVKSVAAVSDTLFIGARAGKTSIEELAGSIGKVAPLAATAGVSFDELVASVSALTLSGVQTTEAVTGVRAIMASIVKPTKEASDLAESLGLQFDAAGLKALGFAGFMEQVVEKTHGSTEQMALLFGGVEALVPALSLAGNAGDSMAKILEQMKTETGATAAAFKRMSEGDAQRLAVAMAQIRDLMIDLGSAILTVLVPAVEVVAKTFKFLADNVDILVIAMGVLAARSIPTLIGGLVTAVTWLGTMEGMFIAGAVASTALGVAMNLIPFVAIVTGLTLAYRWYTSTGEATDAYAASTQQASTQNVELTGTLKSVADGLAVTGDALKELSVTEVLTASATAADQLSEATGKVGDSIIAIGEAARNVAGISVTEEMSAQFYDLAVAVEKGEKPFSELKGQFDALGQASPELRPFIADLFAAVGAADNARDRSDRLAATLRYLKGEATDADQVLLGLVGGAEGVAGSMSKAGAATYTAIPPLTELRAQYGDLALTVRDLLQAQNDLAAQDASVEINNVVIATSAAVEKMGLATAATETFKAKLNEIKTLDTFSAQAQALTQVAAELVNATGGVSKMDTETRKVYDSLLEAALKAADLGGQIDQANSKAVPLAGNLTNAGNAAQTAAGGADVLANKLNVASAAAYALLRNLAGVPAAIGALANQVDQQVAALAQQNRTLTYQTTQGLSAQAAGIKATRDEAINLALANGANIDQAAALGAAFDEQAAKAETLATANAGLSTALQATATSGSAAAGGASAAGKAAADAAKDLETFTKGLDTEFDRLQATMGGAVDQVNAWYAEQKAKLDALGLAHTEYADKLEAIYSDKVAAAYKTDLQNATDWRSGIERAVQGLGESVGNESDLAETALTSLFDNAANAISDFAKTGTLDFKSFARSVAADILQMTTKMLLLAAMKSVLGFSDGGLAGGGGGSPIHLATGGHLSGPGTGTSDAIPAMLSDGEFVVNAKATEQFLPLLEMINSGKQIKLAGGGLGSEGTNLGVPKSTATSDNSAQDAAKGDAGIGGKSLVIQNYVTSKAIAEAMDTPEGEVVVINIIERNRNTVKGLLG